MNGSGQSDRPNKVIVDSLTLRFTGENGDGADLHELRAAHVADVLLGLVGLTSDFDKAGVFHDEGPADSEVLVRPAQDGSFLIEVVRVATENWDVVANAVTNAVTDNWENAQATASALGAPTIAAVVWWATKSLRADVKDFSYLDNGRVKINWQDDTVDEVPLAAWKELQKRGRRRKSQLRQIMAPLADSRVTKVDVSAPVDTQQPELPITKDAAPRVFALDRADYAAARPEDEIKETSEIFEVEAQMSAIDFDNPARWRVKTSDETRTVTVEDQKFLGHVAQGLAISQQDIFWLKIRSDATTKNGSTRTKWTVVSVERHRRAAGDNESQEHSPPSA
ncbi:hypothetical protein [Mycolicibacter algericus]|uniref:Uncharacterized protein n=3 Tax=Mycolicibacter algericus TaxID=1288388 RepID=A0A7I9Y422_MYCAL|nr:hypothetical protein [Mycolicibacter algericus]OQZ94320.1 hypothetical protein BST10_18785 [Mycolicibacter algericus DSM 45454]GFG83410.1 hypothetical protein MALGJ_00860 [Mycolicibacter algericus]